MADKFSDGRVVLVGDSAHSFPPAGGLGMNSGIMDAHNLAFRIAEGLTTGSLEDYSAERTASVKKNLEAANSLFDRSMKVAKALGLDINNLRQFESLVSPFKSLPFSQTAFKWGVKAGSLHLESDLVAQGLADSLRKKNIHIPLVLLENEFQSKVDLPASHRPQAGPHLQLGRRLLLLPSARVTLFRKRPASLDSTSVVLREIASAIDTSMMQVAIERGRPQIEAGKPGENEVRVYLIEGSEKEIESVLSLNSYPEGYYMSHNDLAGIIPDLESGLMNQSRLAFRKDGYLEVQASTP